MIVCSSSPISSCPSRFLERQQRQLCHRPFQERLQRCAVAAMTFVTRRGSWAVPSPLQPIDELILCVLSHHLVDDDNNHAPLRVQHLFRAYRASVDALTGQVVWGGPDQLMCAFDLAVPFDRWTRDTCLVGDGTPTMSGFPEQAFPGVGSRGVGPRGAGAEWLVLALDMDRACQRAATGDGALPTRPTLPPPVLELAPGTMLEPQPTPAVSGYATWHRLSMTQAWEHLREQWRIPAESEDGHQVLVDARLVNQRRLGSGKVLRTLHNLGGFVGPARGRRLGNPVHHLTKVRLPNPAADVMAELNLRQDELGLLPIEKVEQIIDEFRRRLGAHGPLFNEHDVLQALISEESLIDPTTFDQAMFRAVHDANTVGRVMRLALPPRIRAGCTDEDLDRAMAHPGEPLIASRIPRIHLWRLPAGEPEEVFRESAGGQTVRADLWGLPPEWLKSLTLQEGPESEPTSVGSEDEQLVAVAEAESVAA